MILDTQNTKRRPLKPPDAWQWFSICSRHPTYTEDCGTCNAGRWINEASDYERLLQWLWNRSPRLWKKWVNRADSKDTAHLEEIFPKLKGGHIPSSQQLTRWEHLMAFLFAGGK